MRVLGLELLSNEENEVFVTCVPQYSYGFIYLFNHLFIYLITYFII